MINASISILIFTSNRQEADLIKAQITSYASNCLFLTAFSIRDFKRKLNWFPTTFIIIHNEQKVKAALDVLHCSGHKAPNLIISTNKEDPASLAVKLSALHEETKPFRESQEQARREKIAQQRKNAFGTTAKNISKSLLIGYDRRIFYRTKMPDGFGSALKSFFIPFVYA